MNLLKMNNSPKKKSIITHYNTMMNVVIEIEMHIFYKNIRSNKHSKISDLSSPFTIHLT